MHIIHTHSLFEDNFSDSKDISALTTYRVLVNIHGYANKYIKNTGGGITLLNSRVDVNGRIEFHDNQAVFGGGFALSGRCLVSNICLVITIKFFLFRFYFIKTQVCCLKGTELLDLVQQSM